MQVAGGWRLRLCRIQEWCSSGGEAEGKEARGVGLLTCKRSTGRRQHSNAPTRTNIMGSDLRL
jgi:hypothetical protein